MWSQLTLTVEVHSMFFATASFCECGGPCEAHGIPPAVEGRTIVHNTADKRTMTSKPEALKP